MSGSNAQSSRRLARCMGGQLCSDCRTSRLNCQRPLYGRSRPSMGCPRQCPRCSSCSQPKEFHSYALVSQRSSTPCDVRLSFAAAITTLTFSTKPPADKPGCTAYTVKWMAMGSYPRRRSSAASRVPNRNGEWPRPARASVRRSTCRTKSSLRWNLPDFTDCPASS